MIRVMLVDDQEMVRAGFRMLLQVEHDITIVAEAGDGAEAVRLAESSRPDVILMDVQMPRMNGLEATAAIVEAGREADGSGSGRSGPKVVILTTFEQDDYIFEALRQGAGGFCSRTPGPRTWSRPSASLPPVMPCSTRR